MTGTYDNLQKLASATTAQLDRINRWLHVTTAEPGDVGLLLLWGL